MVWPSGTQSTWTIPRMSKKKDHHSFKCGFALPCFLLPWWTGALPVHGLSLTFWVLLKKTMIHHKLLRSLKSLDCFQCFDECQHKCSFEFPFVQEWRDAAPTSNTLFFVLKLLCKICRTVSLSMLINSATAGMLRRRFCRIISPIFSMLAYVFDVLGRPGRWSSPFSSHPSLNLLSHSKT